MSLSVSQHSSYSSLSTSLSGVHRKRIASVEVSSSDESSAVQLGGGASPKHKGGDVDARYEEWHQKWKEQGVGEALKGLNAKGKSSNGSDAWHALVCDLGVKAYEKAIKQKLQGQGNGDLTRKAKVTQAEHKIIEGAAKSVTKDDFKRCVVEVFANLSADQQEGLLSGDALGNIEEQVYRDAASQKLAGAKNASRVVDILLGIKENQQKNGSGVAQVASGHFEEDVSDWISSSDSEGEDSSSHTSGSKQIKGSLSLSVSEKDDSWEASGCFEEEESGVSKGEVKKLLTRSKSGILGDSSAEEESEVSIGDLFSPTVSSQPQEALTRVNGTLTNVDPSTPPSSPKIGGRRGKVSTPPIAQSPRKLERKRASRDLKADVAGVRKSQEIKPSAEAIKTRVQAFKKELNDKLTEQKWVVDLKPGFKKLFKGLEIQADKIPRGSNKSYIILHQEFLSKKTEDSPKKRALFNFSSKKKDEPKGAEFSPLEVRVREMIDREIGQFSEVCLSNLSENKTRLFSELLGDVPQNLLQSPEFRQALLDEVYSTLSVRFGTYLQAAFSEENGRITNPIKLSNNLLATEIEKSQGRISFPLDRGIFDQTIGKLLDGLVVVKPQVVVPSEESASSSEEEKLDTDNLDVNTLVPSLSTPSTVEDTDFNEVGELLEMLDRGLDRTQNNRNSEDDLDALLESLEKSQKKLGVVSPQNAQSVTLNDDDLDIDVILKDLLQDLGA